MSHKSSWSWFPKVGIVLLVRQCGTTTLWFCSRRYREFVHNTTFTNLGKFFQLENSWICGANVSHIYSHLRCCKDAAYFKIENCPSDDLQHDIRRPTACPGTCSNGNLFKRISHRSTCLVLLVLLVCVMLRLILLLVAYSHCRKLKIELAIFGQAHILNIVALESLS